jgi:adenine phosphoribosyltransferase
MTEAELRTYIRDIPDFPKPGIVFKDITPLLVAGTALQAVVDMIADRYRGKVDMVLGIEFAWLRDRRARRLLPSD